MQLYRFQTARIYGLWNFMISNGLRNLPPYKLSQVLLVRALYSLRANESESVPSTSSSKTDFKCFPISFK